MSYEKPARTANWIQRLATFASLALIIVFFFLRPEKSTARLVLFLLWFAYAAYATVKLLSELVSGSHMRQEKFETMLARWEEEQGGRKQAMTPFVAVTAVSVIAKLAVPVLLWLIP
ncbi:hypothetical protein CE91St41_00880 [Oscillospiraceae bacterium]|nr:hypothetical protein CE91St40_00880 [Oscillospiraceae bacterium]BDF73199.1 hypothetical protein CE91St41_00880 [Oscillospiraceae bacterium]